MSDVLISIIVPVYNTPKEKLDACIDSLLTQTNVSFEAILVDDGSKEELGRYIDHYPCRDKRIHVVHQKNGGVSAARNKGIDIAKGDFVIFVDADDCINPVWISKAVDCAIEQNVDIVFGKVVMCQEVPKPTTEIIIRNKVYVFEHEDLWKVQEALLLNATDMFLGLEYLDRGPCGKLFRRESIGEKRFPLGIKLSEDQVFVQAVLKGSKKCIVTSDEAYYYIENVQSASHSYHPDAVDVIEKAMSLIGNCLFQGPEIQQAYCFRVIDDMLNAIQFAYFHKENSVSAKKQILGVRYALSKQLLSKALMDLGNSNTYPKLWKLKVWLLKNSPAMFVAFKRAYQLVKR